MLTLLVTFVAAQATLVPLRFIVSHNEVGTKERALLTIPRDKLAHEARKLNLALRLQSDSIAIHDANLYDVQRVETALKGQRALAEVIRQKRKSFTLSEFTGDARDGLEEMLRRGALNVGSAALDPGSTLFIGFHYYVTLEGNGKSIEKFLSVLPEIETTRVPEVRESTTYENPAPPPDINRLFVATETPRTPSQRRARAIAELMEHFGRVIERQNEDIVSTFASLEDAGSWDQSYTVGMTTKGFDDVRKKDLMSSLEISPNYGFENRNEVERFVDAARITKLRRCPSIQVTGMMNGRRKTVTFSATVNRGG